MNSENDINAYLFYGYVPKVDNAFLERIVKFKCQEVAAPNNTDYVMNGVNALKDVFIASLADKRDGFSHIVPLSGGLDSRAILGGLVYCVDTKDICTVTFGSPNAWDYEIGSIVAKSIGVRNEQINLAANSWKWRTEDLVNSAKGLEQPIWIFDKYVNDEIVKRFDGTDVCFWSGFMGDPLAGSHLQQIPSPSWEASQNNFCNKNRFCNDIDLFNSGFSAKKMLPSEPIYPSAFLTFDEQLDFAVRQAGPIRQVVAPITQKYISPFMDMRWISFILNAPYEMRLNQFLYKAILVHAYPTLFSLPTKTYNGLPLTATPSARRLNRYMEAALSLIWKIQGKDLLRTRSVNYINFNTAIRSRGEFRMMVEENLSDLRRRDICGWINIDEIFKCCVNGRNDYFRGITQLVSLEIFLKSIE